jgi:3-(methylthio)propanoyl-CoA dehydrogenase
VRGGASFLEFIATMRDIEPELSAAGSDFDSIREELTRQLDALEKATKWMLGTGTKDPNSVLAGSVPYLRMWGLCVGGWLMARSALAGLETGDPELGDTQLVLARFYAEQLLPQASGLLGAATAGSRDLFALDADQLAGVTRRLVK